MSDNEQMPTEADPANIIRDLIGLGNCKGAVDRAANYLAAIDNAARPTKTGEAVKPPCDHCRNPTPHTVCRCYHPRSTKAGEVTVTAEDVRAEAIAIIVEEAEELGFPDDTLTEFRDGQFDGDDVLTLQAVERALRHRTQAFARGEQRGIERAAEWQPMDTAPKDNTIVELVVDYSDGDHPLADATLACTIGFNSFDDSGEDEWKFAGWCWSHDHFVQGKGKPVAWRPSRLNAHDDGLAALPTTQPEGEKP